MTDLPSAQQTEPAVSDIVMMDALPLGRALRARQLSCVEVMKAYLDHIERFNPKVNAIISLRERGELIAEAGIRDDQLKRGEDMGPLHGMPQAIKDLAATKGLRTTQGSPLYKDTVPDADALFVERMRNAGAIIIGKTNTPEFGLGSQTYNPLFGLTRNAYDQTRTSGGSSGGAAVALALRMLPVADGSDHGGSLRNPAAFNNVLGFRTSYGRVPHHNEDVFLTGLSVKGPMARTVEDLQMLLSVQAGYDDRVPLSIADPHSYVVEQLKCDVKGKRIGWIGEFGNLPMEAGVRELCRGALRTFESMGCIVEDVTPDFDPEAIWQAWLVLRAWLTGSKLRVHYDNPASRTHMKPEAQWEVEEAYKLSAFDLAAASEVRNAWYREVRRLFQRYDYLTLPSAAVFPFPVETHWPQEIAGKKMDTYHRWMQVVIPITMSGCPSLGMPVGLNAAGLPMGMQVVGPSRAEHAVMRLANAYEEATGWTRKVLPPLLGR
ncbi:amidase [Bradyrhizobium sp. LHD-71]|uniref:amidase n=1 Tax=Bradyrhizobium sp. LHD-71 TaxID=3072141 RepID=UPI00280FDA30|nr:amidase [Bradyrhizobium sp. LHD-71]MDQ8730283.1 amidase [Bradyrhizobium sp. LHD-71]